MHVASEWLLHYSLPILKGLLPDYLWWHHALLVGAMHLSDSLSEERQFEAGVMIEKYSVFYNRYYGATYLPCYSNLQRS